MPSPDRRSELATLAGVDLARLREINAENCAYVLRFIALTIGLLFIYSQVVDGL